MGVVLGIVFGAILFSGVVFLVRELLILRRKIQALEGIEGPEFLEEEEDV